MSCNKTLEIYPGKNKELPEIRCIHEYGDKMNEVTSDKKQKEPVKIHHLVNQQNQRRRLQQSKHHLLDQYGHHIFIQRPHVHKKQFIHHQEEGKWKDVEVIINKQCRLADEQSRYGILEQDEQHGEQGKSCHRDEQQEGEETMML